MSLPAFVLDVVVKRGWMACLQQCQNLKHLNNLDRKNQRGTFVWKSSRPIRNSGEEKKKDFCCAMHYLHGDNKHKHMVCSSSHPSK